MTRFTLWGLAQYDPQLFNNVVLPDGLDKELCINNIMNKSGDLYLYYQVPTRAKIQIEDWFSMHYLGFKRMIEALLKEYNPIENTDRYEDETSTLDSVRQNKASGNDKVNTTLDSSVVNDGEGKVSAFDSGDYQPHEKSDNTETTDSTSNQTNTYGRVDDATGNDTTHRVLHTHGNIGVTSNQEMVRQELELRVYNIYDVIAEMFENDILIQVY